MVHKVRFLVLASIG